jgi:hypothetical protein
MIMIEAVLVRVPVAAGVRVAGAGAIGVLPAHALAARSPAW